MKTIFSPLSCAVLFCSLLITGCGGGSESSPGKERTPWDIRKELMEVQMEVNAFVQENGLEENEILLKAEETMFEMAKSFNQSRRELPELAPLYTESDALQNEAIQKKLAGDEAGYDAAMAAFRDLRSQLEQKAATLPEVKELKARLDQAEQDTARAIAGVVAEVNAEGKKLADTLTGLLDELDAAGAP